MPELRRHTPSKTVVAFGTFDLLHVGHLRILQRARALGTRLVVGVSTDALNAAKKGRAPVYDQQQRAALVAALRCVDEVFFEESLALKAWYLQQVHADLLVMGDDHTGRFDAAAAEAGCQVVYLPRTPEVSTTATIAVIQSRE